MAKFQKGQSGNPGGRMKMPGEIKDALKEHTPKAIETLVSIMNNARAPANARIAAANSMLDRAWGKPVQSVNASVNGIGSPLHGMSFEEKLEAIKSTMKPITEIIGANGGAIVE
jgi:hypothetical protein